MVPLRAAALVLLATGCGSSPPEPGPYPLAFSMSDAGGHRVELRFLLRTATADCATDSVVVTGPGLSAPLALGCEATRKPAFMGAVDLGPAGPAPPLTYTFTATLGARTTEHVATVDCYLALPVAIAPAPGATVQSPVTFQWTLVGEKSIEYRVGPPDANGWPAYSVVDQGSIGVALAPGSYGWEIWAAPVGLYDGSSALKCGSRWSGGGFTVE